MKDHGEKKQGGFIHYSYYDKSLPGCIITRCVKEEMFFLIPHL